MRENLMEYELFVSCTIGMKKIKMNVQTPAEDKSDKVINHEADLREVLDTILPPHPVTDEQGNEVWRRAVDRVATRRDVIRLQKRLDKKLEERQARETGICPIREQLYSEAFGTYRHRFLCSR